MIYADEIRKIARQEKLAAGVVEKDYALSWLLKGFQIADKSVGKNFVLKGGTAIRKVYFPGTWRFSEDLDFTIINAVESNKIKEFMLQIFENLRLESGINFSLESFHTTEGSIIANVQFLGPLNFRNRIRHDFSLKEKIVLKPEYQILSTNYSDLSEFNVIVYSLLEVLVEKIRSII